ncbi:MAG TPA: phosphatase PAP2 family protein [Steroidobacteraceae bacterium]|nr:phosphatase PAP2 family protein [Steroidobacteraceae bacterium]
MSVPKRRAIRARAACLTALSLAVLACAWPALSAPSTASAPRGAGKGLYSDVAQCADLAALKLVRLLPPPPGEGSPEERAELDELLRLQANRTAAQAERARQDAEVSVFRFANALGNPAGFTPANLPLTVRLFRRIDGDEAAVLGAAKHEFSRPRPFTVEPRLNPVIPRPASSSYPSGHSTWAYVTGLVLADMIPERRAAILARADEFAHNRSVAGVHYPSDVEAGRLAGTTLAAMLFACGPFEAEEAAARAELRKALGLR